MEPPTSWSAATWTIVQKMWSWCGCTATRRNSSWTATMSSRASRWPIPVLLSSLGLSFVWYHSVAVNPCVHVCVLVPRCCMLTAVRHVSTAPSRMGSAMSSCRGTPWERRMSGTPRCSGRNAPVLPRGSLSPSPVLSRGSHIPSQRVEQSV